MELRRYWFTLLRWWWLIALTTVLAAGVSYVVSKSTKPVYSASVTILVNQAQNPTTPNYDSVLVSERLTQTYSQLIKTRPIADKVIQTLGLKTTPDEFERAISIQVVPNTQLIQVSVENTNPSLARDLANTLANDFITENRAETVGLTANSQQVLQQQVSDMENQMKDETTRLEQLRASNAAQSPEALQLLGLIQQQQITYSQLLRNQQAMQLSEATSFDSVRIVEPAVLPEFPVRPKVLLYVLLAAAAGLVLGLSAAFLIEYLDDTVKSPSDVEEAVGLSSLGTIMRMPASSDRETRLIDQVSSRSAIAEAYRVLRTNIDFARVGLPGNALLVTSSNQGEGKTTTSSNLAIVMAESGRRVIVVDSDLRRPMQHKNFGVPNTVGLTNLLLQEDPDIQQALQSTRVPNLQIITSGPIPPNPSELLGSDRMLRLLERLRGMADLVILDSPPVLAVTDPTVLSSRVDGVVLVVDTGHTRAESLTRATETLKRGAAPMLGVVLNRVTSRAGGYYYYHYYYSPDGTAPQDANGAVNGAANGAVDGHGHHRPRKGGLLETVRHAVLRQ
jgi:capsular exopolysaccharide synthesis family protein